MGPNSIQFAHAAHINPQPNPKPNASSQRWAMLAAGLAAGLLGMYVTVTRPMSDRIEFLETDIAMMQTEMRQLVGTRDDLWRTNDLLTGLRQQQRQLGEAERALAAMRALRNEVIALRNDHDVAVASLTRVSELQSDLAGQHADLVETRSVVQDLATVQQEIVALGENASERRAELIAVGDTLTAVAELTTRINNQGDGIAAARTVVAAIDSLSQELTAQQGSLDAARAVVANVKLLEGELRLTADLLPAAQNNLAELQQLQQTLVAQEPTTLQAAATNLAALNQLSRDLSVGREQISSAITTVELLADFQNELERQATRLTSMRQDLMEITFLETAFKQTLETLKPLIQLSDLRRMNACEVREAARMLMDRRLANGQPTPETTNRVAEHDLPTPTRTPLPETSADQKVPTPIDLE